MPALSAMSIAVARTAIAQYGLRILRNTKEELEEEVKTVMLTELCERLRDSGWGTGTGQKTYK